MPVESIYFLNPEDPFGCLSNASRHQVYIDGMSWQTAEHYFQTAKFKDAKLRYAIIRAETPDEARRIAHQHRRDQRPDWHKIKVGVMRNALSAKARQNADVRAVLLITAPARLKQHAKTGDFWGGKKNMLGKLWMQERDRLGESGEFDSLNRPLPPPWEKYPELHRASIGWRMGYGEAYMEEWDAYFYGLSPAGRSRYQQIFTPPKEWHGFYDR